ncbi:hypothetical protein AJ80_07088 [Polytolypa hystricis UAMH7299]|uniref:Uncharacterized protein n=1 Tax=Polytolypa hystricis (strain UAMH7299) TaxID=1447883 RepID=A0A2B7XSB4_POLH7|nr:hypothetical protein AJ80_07088 [Polytolypa hystricis UAMH7299]
MHLVYFLTTNWPSLRRFLPDYLEAPNCAHREPGPHKGPELEPGLWQILEPREQPDAVIEEQRSERDQPLSICIPVPRHAELLIHLIRVFLDLYRFDFLGYNTAEDGSRICLLRLFVNPYQHVVKTFSFPLDRHISSNRSSEDWSGLVPAGDFLTVHVKTGGMEGAESGFFPGEGEVPTRLFVSLIMLRVE